MSTPDPNQQAPRYDASAGYAAPAYSPGAVPGPGEPFDGAAHPDDLSRPLYGATFGQAVKRFFKQYAKFSGRASRSEFWWATLFVVLINLVPLALVTIGGVSAAAWASQNTVVTDMGGGVEFETDPGLIAAPAAAIMIIGVILAGVLGLALLIPQLALYWRRLHDANLAGPFYFLTLTSIGSIVVFVFTLLPPKPEGRRFVSTS